MTTTSHLQIGPDYYSTLDEAEEASKIYENSNSRYKSFLQKHFTCGDEEQFEEHRRCNAISKKGEYVKIIPELIHEFWKGYKDADAVTTLNTFRYMFNKFKKGIFIKIQNNKLAVFLPFSKNNFVNDWHDKIAVEGKDMMSFLKKISESENRPFNPKRINRFTNSWYANNCLLRNEYPVRESDTNIGVLKNMFEELCDNRKVPNMEFFLNKRDFPLLKCDGSEPYDHIFDGPVPLQSHKYDSYAPIFSMSKTDRFADILIPTCDDWVRVQQKEGKYFPRANNSFEEDFFSISWKEKKPIAVFRGSSTGSGVTDKYTDKHTDKYTFNPRIKIARMSAESPRDSDGSFLLDAGITQWNLRPRKICGEKFIKTIDVRALKIDTVRRLSSMEQARYKYIVYIQGHAAAFRLSLQLGMGSVILMVDSEYSLWFSQMLQPYVHFVPVQSDLTDLLDRIRWCKNHDVECEQIAKNAREFYLKHLCKESIFDFLQTKLYSLKQFVGEIEYSGIHPFEKQIQEEERMLIEWKEESCARSVKRATGLPTPPSAIAPSAIAMQQLLDRAERGFNLNQAIMWLLHGSRYDFLTHLSNEDSKTISVVMGIGGMPMAVKSTFCEKKRKEQLHETFVYFSEVNRLSKIVPNFNFAYDFDVGGGCGGNHLLMQYLEGETFFKYIQSTEFNIEVYLEILVQIGLALQVAQQECNFCHNDLTPWNIILVQNRDCKNRMNDYMVTTEEFGGHRVFRMSSAFLPVMIDFGKSHVVHSGMHYGHTNMYSSSRIQDVISILTTSANAVLSFATLTSKEEKTMIHLCNFLTGGEYCKERFYNIGSLRNFLFRTRNHSALTLSNKHELENNRPIDFAQHVSGVLSSHLCKRAPMQAPMQEIDRLEMLPCNAGNAAFYFDCLLLSQNSIADGVKTSVQRLEKRISILNKERGCINVLELKKLRAMTCSLENQFHEFGFDAVSLKKTISEFSVEKFEDEGAKPPALLSFAQPQELIHNLIDIDDSIFDVPSKLQAYIEKASKVDCEFLKKIVHDNKEVQDVHRIRHLLASISTVLNAFHK
jgi:hypothetical protein